MNYVSSLVLGCALFACTAETQPTKPASPDTSSSAVPAAGSNSAATSKPASKPSDPPADSMADPMAAPDTAFARQLELVRATDVEGLRECLVSAVRDQVRLEDLEFAKERMGSVPAHDVAATISVKGETAEIFQKSGAAVTTLVRVDGKWLGRSIWWVTKKKD